LNFFKQKFAERKKIFTFAAAIWGAAGYLDDHAELVKTNKLMLQVAENDKCTFRIGNTFNKMF